MYLIFDEEYLSQINYKLIITIHEIVRINTKYYCQMIFSMDELIEKGKHANKEVLKKYWSRDVMLEKTKNLIETMRNIT